MSGAVQSMTARDPSSLSGPKTTSQPSQPLTFQRVADMAGMAGKLAGMAVKEMLDYVDWYDDERREKIPTAEQLESVPLGEKYQHIPNLVYATAILIFQKPEKTYEKKVILAAEQRLRGLSQPPTSLYEACYLKAMCVNVVAKKCPH